MRVLRISRPGLHNVSHFVRLFLHNFVFTLRGYLFPCPILPDFFRHQSEAFTYPDQFFLEIFTYYHSPAKEC